MAHIKSDVPKYGASKRDADISTVITVAPPIKTRDINAMADARFAVVAAALTVAVPAGCDAAVACFSVVVAKIMLLKEKAVRTLHAATFIIP